MLVRVSVVDKAGDGRFATPVAQERANINRRRRLAKRSGLGVQGTLIARQGESL